MQKYSIAQKTIQHMKSGQKYFKKSVHKYRKECKNNNIKKTSA